MAISAIDYGKLSEAINDKADRDYMNCDYIPVSDSEFEIADAENVKLSNNQIISGVKEYNSPIDIKTSTASAIYNYSSLTTHNMPSTPPTSDKNIGSINFRCSDSNVITSSFQVARRKDNSISTFIYSSQTINGSRKIAGMRINCNADGTGNITGLTPTNNASTTEIPTTAWVRNHTFAPSSKYISMTLEASGSTYTAPANGYFDLDYKSATANSYVNIYPANGRDCPGSMITQPLANIFIHTYVPVIKGCQIKITYNNTPSNANLTFIYAEIDSY